MSPGQKLKIATIAPFELSSFWPVRVNEPVRRVCGHFTILCRLLHEWRRRRRSRDQLLHLDNRMLRDMGITAAEACAEANKPFWRR